MTLKISTADNDIRYVPDEASVESATFCSIAHESRYLWARNTFAFTGARVLDFGCGSGYGSAILAQSGAKHVLGLDISSTSIDFATRRYGGQSIEFRCMNLEAPDLPLSLDERFDFVVSFDVVEHTEHYWRFVENAAALLNPGGTAVIGCPNRHETFDFNSQWNPYHVQEFTPDQFRWLHSLYFANCELLGQGFRDKDVRARYTVSATATTVFRHGFARLFSKWRRSVAKRIPWGSFAKQSNADGPSVDDLQFFAIQPNTPLTFDAFGLIAVCSGPRTTGAKQHGS